jgi:selenocysteine lyase/cysteine desulfurase
VQGQLPGQQFPYQGIRVTPNVYTTLEEIDTFASAVEEVLKKGLPAPRTGA